MQIEDVVFVYRLSSPELVRWHSRRHSHGPEEYELHYFLGGDGRFENGRDRYVIAPGTLFFSPPEERHAVQPGDVRKPVSYFAVLFSLSRTNPLRSALDAGNFYRSFPRRAGSRHRLLFEDLKTAYGHIEPARRNAAEHKLQAFLWELIAEAGTEAGTAGTEAGPAPPQNPATTDSGSYNVHIDRALQIFEAKLSANLAVHEVADALGVSQAHLTRLFTQHLGVSPLQYYRRLRMDVAASMLLDTNRSIKEIAWELGYSNAFHFSRSFSRYARMSPSEYRHQYYRNNPTEYASRVVTTPPGRR